MALSRYMHFFILLIAAATISAKASAQQLRILYYSSMPEIVRDGGRPGLAQVATVVREEREENEAVVFVHGGASLGPSVLGALDHGAHMIDVLNMIEPDLMAVGKREFSYKEDQFTLHALSAGFPFVASNVVRENDGQLLEAIEPSFIAGDEGFEVGFISLISSNAVSQYGAHSLKVLPTDSSVRVTAQNLRDQGADAIVLLADTDFNDMSRYTGDGTVDAVLYAHNFDNLYSADAGGTTIREGALDGKLVVLTLEQKTTETGSTIYSKIETIDLRSKEKDPEVQSLIQSYASRLEILLQQELGVTTRSFNTIRETVRTKENAFGNLVADAVREAMRADVAFLNSGGIRGNRYYHSGQMLTREDIQLELPFNNTVELFEVTGEQLKQALERGISCIETVDGCFLQVSNIKMSYDPALPKGSRIQNIAIGDAPINLSQSYSLGTLNFLAAGGDGFDMLTNSPRLTRAGSGKVLWEVVANYLSALPEITPKLEGRLTVKSDPDSSQNQ